MILIVLQVLILRRKAKLLDIVLQIPMSFFFGYVIDFSMWLLGRFSPAHYPAKQSALLMAASLSPLGLILR